MTTLTTSEPKTGEPRSYLLLSLRIILGVLFLAAGIAKLVYPGSFLNTLAAFSFLPHGLLNVIGVALPAAEVGLGCLLISGLFRKSVAITGAIFALAFIGVNAYSYLSGYRADCGCFGRVPLLHWQALVLDMAMLIMALAQLARRHIQEDRDILRYRQLTRWLVPVASVVMLVATLIVPAPPALGIDGSTSSQLSHPIMHFTLAQSEEMEKAYQNAPRAPIAESPSVAPLYATSTSLLSYLQYTPSERDQGQAGNCWVWAGTGVTEIALDVQNSVKDRLSIQYFDSKYNGGSGANWAGCGGDIFKFAGFYTGTGRAIPWSNTNASYQDASKGGCPDTAAVNASDIGMRPYYPITSMVAQTITTTGVSQATAIANIKNVLNQNKAVYFSFFLPTNDAWANFRNFWANGQEADVWSPSYCGTTIDPNAWGGHAVLCYGYDDATNSWLMLNSWGTTANRPNGLFRVTQNLNYSCVYRSYGANYHGYFFQTLNSTFGTITVTSPNGGESWAVGSTHPITWTSVGLTGNVGIELSRDGGATWATIITSTPNTGTASWTVTGPGTTQARILIGSSDYPGDYDTSDANFTISPCITVTSPNGGESWAVGSTQPITWTSVGLTGNVTIELSRNGGATWTTLSLRPLPILAQQTGQ